MKSTRQLRIVISAIALCAILFGAYFVIRITTKKSTEKDRSDTDGAYILVDRNGTEKVSYFSFTDGENIFAFEKQNGIWRYKENTTLPTNAERINEYLESCELILAKKLISENCDDLLQYSLSEPKKNLTIVADGVKKSYLFGETIESKGLCYMLDSRSGSVYLVDISFTDTLSVELSEFFTSDSHSPPEKDAIQQVTVTSPEFSKEIIPDGIPGSSASLLTEAISSIKITEFVDFGRDCFDTFGLSESEAIEMKVITDKKEIRYIFGLGESEEFIYLLVENESGILSEMVYLFSCDNFSHLYSVLSQK